MSVDFSSAFTPLPIQLTMESAVGQTRFSRPRDVTFKVYPMMAAACWHMSTTIWTGPRLECFPTCGRLSDPAVNAE